MKCLAIAIAAAVCIGTTVCSAQALPLHQSPSGLSFRTPTGWNTNIVQDTTALIPPDFAATNELYAVATLAGVKDLKDPQLLTLLEGRYFPEGMKAKSAGTPVSFQAEGGEGRAYVYDFVSDSQPGRLQFFVVGLRTGGVACLIAIAKPELLASRQAALVTVAKSLNQQQSGAAAATVPAAPAGSGTQLTRSWTQRLSDKKLVQFSGYNSGGGSGGYSSERKLYLAADGRYSFQSSSSVSVYVPGASGGSAGSKAQNGRWRVIEQGGQAMLELISQEGTREAITLSTDGTKTFLNGNRWFVVGINE